MIGLFWCFGDDEIGHTHLIGGVCCDLVVVGTEDLPGNLDSMSICIGYFNPECIINSFQEVTTLGQKLNIIIGNDIGFQVSF